MSTRIIEPPTPIVTPADIPGDHAADDAFITLLIGGVQSEIDGARGWLGRALGVQTIELTGDCMPDRLPFQPIIEVISVTVDGEEVDVPAWEQDGRLTWDRRIGSGTTVIRYRAGYDADKTGPVPPNAKAAIILATNLLKSMGEGDIFQQQESVVGIGATSRNVTPYVAETIEKAVGNLLAPLRVYR
ncbi:hypothetical protein [Aliihoeflea sp. PC F10.4]